METEVSNTLRIGYYIPPKKIEKMKLDEFFELARKQKGVEVISIDISKDISTQGPFDVVLHKVNSEIVSKNEEEQKLLEKYEQYFIQNPQVIQIDPISSQKATLDRDKMNQLFTYVEKELPKEFKVRNPRHIYIEKSAPVYQTEGLEYPVVCKANQAGGSSSAHKMGIVFNEKGLHEFTPPMIVQEFYQHNYTIFKVFVIGEFTLVVKRKSVPNLPSSHTENIYFDSQHPLEPQLKEFVPDMKEQEKLFENTPQPPQHIIHEMAQCLSKHFQLSLFGFDVITRADTNEHAIIDINYFPGYIGVPNFAQLLLDHILARVKAAKN